jgi:pimeloyl-ACP methyl ester carboxylesterase
VAAFGQRFSTNGHQLYLRCEGKRSASTVVLIAGGGGTTETWDKVQSPISKFAEVCSYDRLGLGNSDHLDSDSQQSVSQIVADLEALLKAAKIHPPYLLVGHSIGGLYARAFDERFDNQVAGMVLLDSSHEEQIWRFAKGDPDALKEYPRWRDQQYMLSQGFLPPGEHLKWRFTKPLIVIEHGVPPEPVWHEMQLDLAGRSKRSRFLTATDSSHYIQKLQPQLVIDAVHTLEESQGSLSVSRDPEREGSRSDH